MKDLIVTEKFNNKKLIYFLNKTFPNLNNNIIFKTLRKKDIIINNTRINSNVIVKTNDNIKIYISDELLYNNINYNLDIIFEDENILILNKPSGINVIEITGETSLNDIVKNAYLNNSFIPKPCHRLDRNTSGLIIYAKNEQSLNVLLNSFKNNEIKKYYICKVYGIPTQNAQTLHSYLFKDSKKSLVYISDTIKKGYLPIVTSYKILNKNTKENTAILEVNIETGRTHQIRAQLAHIGYPIIGDGKYGINNINKKFNAKYQQLYSYKIIFKFKNKNYLYYLNEKSFEIKPNI